MTMTREQILALEPGRELDVLIGKHVFGADVRWNPCYQAWMVYTRVREGLEDARSVPDYSTTWEGMGSVVEKLHYLKYDFTLDNLGHPEDWRCHVGKEGPVSEYADGMSAPAAVCKAALCHFFKE